MKKQSSSEDAIEDSDDNIQTVRSKCAALVSSSLFDKKRLDGLKFQFRKSIKTHCECINTKCLHESCSCYSNSNYCSDSCSCNNCSNSKTMTILRKGCKCRRSNCIQRYCECYSKGVVCSSFCKCEDCKNNPNTQSNNEPASTISFSDHKHKQAKIFDPPLESSPPDAPRSTLITESFAIIESKTHVAAPRMDFLPSSQHSQVFTRTQTGVKLKLPTKKQSVSFSSVEPVQIQSLHAEGETEILATTTESLSQISTESDEPNEEWIRNLSQFHDRLRKNAP